MAIAMARQTGFRSFYASLDLSAGPFIVQHFIIFWRGRTPRQHEDGRNIDRSLLLSSAIFCSKPSVSARAFRRLLRFVAGLEDYARINAHQPERRLAFPELAQEDLKRSCLFCSVNLKHIFS